MRFGATKEFYPKDVKQVKKLQAKAKKHGIGLLNVRHKHLGSDKLKKIIKRFVDNLKDFGVKFMLNTEVKEFLIKGKTCHGVILKNNKKIKAKHIIACPGRVGSKWMTEQMKNLGADIKHRGIEIGIRVEAPSKIMKHVTDYIWDPVFFMKTDKYKDYVRTFCCCPGGYVAQETYHNFIGVNGYCRKDRKSKNTNFALLVNVKLTHPAEDTIAYGESIARVATTIAGGKPFIQRLDDLKLERRSYWDRINKSKVKPTLRKATPGDLSMAIPHRIVTNLTDALKQLDKVMPGLYKDILIYGPELKFFSVRVKTNKRLETEINNLFVAGDGVGVCGNIIGAAATGCIAARGVLKEKSYK
ncbi:NAD(P)/FAD-dependent oxidoreductase [Nanoarchaeota archaeon]